MKKRQQTHRALIISLMVSVCILVVKLSAYLITSSTAAMSDALESVVHVLAVGFAYYGLRLSNKPADEKHLYGHERVEFLSVGIEGSVILIAGISIIYQSVYHYIFGYHLQELLTGIWLMGIAAVVNLVLGMYISHIGRKWNNNIVISNGKHTLTDVWTSAGVVITLLVVTQTQWYVLDSVVGILFAAYIMYEGGKLMTYAINGIMDKRNPEIDKKIQEVLKKRPLEIKEYHKVRHRTTGSTTWIEFHALFDNDIALEKAHDIATVLEKQLIDALPGGAVVTIHLEPEENHEESHSILHHAKTDKKLDDFI